MKIWINKRDEYLCKFLQPDTEIRFIEDDCVTEDGVVLLKSDDNKNSFISGCRVIRFDKDLANIKHLALQKLYQNYDYYVLNYNLNREHDFDTVVVGSSYPLFGLDI